MFVQEYLSHRNATRAAKSAGYSDKSAFITGSKLLKNPKIAEIIETKTEKRIERLEITADSVAQELGTVGFAKVRRINGNQKVTALGMLAKVLNMFKDTVDVNLSANPDAELRELLAGLSRRASERSNPA
jgi:phage terminase small subunit